jgi:hypothetical protein
MSRPGFVAVVLGVLAMAASIADATSNLNLSKSNINRVAHSRAVGSGTATAILNELDLKQPANEAAVQDIVRKHVTGVKSARGQDLVIRVRPLAGGAKGWAVLILDDPAEEAEAAKLAGAGTGSTSPSNVRSGYDLKSGKSAIK